MTRTLRLFAARAFLTRRSQSEYSLTDRAAMQAARILQVAGCLIDAHHRAGIGVRVFSPLIALPRTTNLNCCGSACRVGMVAFRRPFSSLSRGGASLFHERQSQADSTALFRRNQVDWPLTPHSVARRRSTTERRLRWLTVVRRIDLPRFTSRVAGRRNTNRGSLRKMFNIGHCRK